MAKLSTSVFRLRDFRPFLFARAFVFMALQSQSVIVGWEVYSLTHDPFLLGLAGLTEALPAIACALFSGHIVDISQPRTVYRICVGTLALNTIFLLVTAGHMTYLPVHALLLCIFAGVFVSGLARSFVMPCNFALLSRIVPRAEIPSASAWLTTGSQTAAVSGPAVAGLIYGGYGPSGAWYLPALLMTAAFCMSLQLSVTHERSGQKREPALKSIRAGLHFIMRTPVLLSVMALDMFAVLFGGATAMLPAFADQILHVGSEGLGALRAAPSLGAVATALSLAVRPMKKISALRLLWMVAGFGFCMIGFGLSTLFWLSMVFLILSGVFDSVGMLIRSTLMQLLTPDDMRGRVASINSMFIISSNEIGAFESGTAARLLGLVPSVVVGGMITLAVVATTALVSPKFRRTIVDTEEKPA